MVNRKIVVSHPNGNANVRYLIKALAGKGLLAHFYTCIALFENSLLFPLFNFGPLREFKKRTFPISAKKYTKQHPFKELVRVVSLKLGYKNLVMHETGKYSVDAVYHDLDKVVAKRLTKSVDAVYAYEDGALYSFLSARKKGVICLYDLPIGYWRAMRHMLEVELKNRPEWADTLTGFKDSETKLKRKDDELANADHIFVASSFTKHTLSYYPHALDNIHVVPYGFPAVFNERSYQPVSGRKIKLLFIGGLSQRKGIANVLEAVEELKDNVSLTVVGRKPTDSCIPLNEGLKKHNYIESLPYLDILKLMREHDIFVFPSLFEGYGLVISEAMSQGTPVISTDRTCAADFIEDNVNGWMVKAGNTQSLADKLRYIISSPEEIQKVGRAAMETARKHPSANYGENMVNKITEILN